MRTKYWRFAYDENKLDEIQKSNTLVFPDLSRYPRAKNNNTTKIISDLKVEHFILMANFDSNNEMGKVKIVGKVISIENEILTVTWKRPIPKWELTPSVQGGVTQWRQEGVFCFDTEPVKRYKLKELTTKLFTQK